MSGAGISESADLTGVGSMSATGNRDRARNAYAGRDGYETSGLFVRATADETIAKVREVEDALRRFLDEVQGQNDPDIKRQLIDITAAIKGLVEMLAGDSLPILEDWLRGIGRDEAADEIGRMYVGLLVWLELPDDSRALAGPPNP